MVMMVAFVLACCGLFVWPIAFTVIEKIVKGDDKIFVLTAILSVYTAALIFALIMVAAR